MNPSIELRRVGKCFDDGPPILDCLELTVSEREIVSIIGPSGCGKSTLLRLLAGLDRQHEGVLLVDGQVVTGPSRATGFVFQEPRLLPWLTVQDNVAFGLRAGHDRHAARDRVATLLGHVQLEAAARLYPRQLSGGMAQRTALARALAAEPSVLLLDEPFSAVDAFTRLRLQDLLLSLWEGARLTMVLVTHDIEEALFLGDRVVVLSDRPGRVIEILTVDVERPRDRRRQALVEQRAHLLEKLRLATSERS